MRLLLVMFTAALVAAACNPKSLKPGYCHDDKDCPGMKCNEVFRCVPSDAGTNDADGRDGGDGGEVGDGGDADVPFRCKGPSDCADGGANVCEIDAGACVECLSDGDCSVASKPICNLTSRTCGPCTSDSQCAAKIPNPGICMFHQDGRCATDAETIYVRNSTGCSATASSGGTKDVPYCYPQTGIDALNATTRNRVVVMIGPTDLRSWTISASGDQVSVIGQGSATIAPGADVGIHVSAGNVYIRGLRVRNSSQTGVIADGNADLHMDGCIVENNAVGGIKVDMATFDITNTVIAKNGSTATAGCGAWAGVCLNSASAGSRFLNNTVVSNVGPGIACATGAPPISGSIISGNTPDVSLCTVISCCTNPALAADYHLMSGSACIDQLDSAMSVARDIDGQLRPAGSKSDCGADEF